MPRHLATKNFWKGVARPGDSPNNPGEVQTFKRSRLTILHREIFEIIVSGDSTVPFHWNGVPTDESLICGFWIHLQHNSEGALLLIIHSQCYVCEVLLIFLEEWVNLPLTCQLELMILFFLFWTSHNMKYPAFSSRQSRHHSPGSHASHLATLAAGECSGRFHHHHYLHSHQFQPGSKLSSFQSSSSLVISKGLETHAGTRVRVLRVRVEVRIFQPLPNPYPQCGWRVTRTVLQRVESRNKQYISHMSTKKRWGRSLGKAP